MFRSSTILMELVQSLAKITLLLKPSLKLRRCILRGDVAACREMERVLFVVQIDCLFVIIILTAASLLVNDIQRIKF